TQLGQFLTEGVPEPFEEPVGLSPALRRVLDREAVDRLSRVPHHGESAVEPVQQGLHQVAPYPYQVLYLVDDDVAEVMLVQLIGEALVDRLPRALDPSVEGLVAPVPLGVDLHEQVERPGVEGLHSHVTSGFAV